MHRVYVHIHVLAGYLTLKDETKVIKLVIKSVEIGLCQIFTCNVGRTTFVEEVDGSSDVDEGTDPL